MKYIFNFIFFGLLFFLIWYYFPDAFAKLFDWAKQIFEFFRGLILTASERMNLSQSPKSLLDLFTSR